MRVASDLTSRCAGQRTVGGKNPELTKLSGRSPDCRTSRIPDFLETLVTALAAWARLGRLRAWSLSLHNTKHELWLLSKLTLVIFKVHKTLCRSLFGHLVAWNVNMGCESGQLTKL